MMRLRKLMRLTLRAEAEEAEAERMGRAEAEGLRLGLRAEAEEAEAEENGAEEAEAEGGKQLRFGSAKTTCRP